MKCPACSNELRITDREGIEIDYCPTCRGVWLDRGELDKIIERSGRYYGERDDDDDDWKRRHPPQSGYGPQHGYPPRKRKGFFGELFDFD